MDSNSKYLTVAIVGQPTRLVLGIQVRFDQDPGFIQSAPSDMSKGKIYKANLLRWRDRASSLMQFRNRVQKDSPTDEAGVRKPNSARNLGFKAALGSFVVIAVLINSEVFFGPKGLNGNTQDGEQLAKINLQPVATPASGIVAPPSVREEQPLPLGPNPASVEASEKQDEAGVQLVDADATLPPQPIPVPVIKVVQPQNELKPAAKTAEKVTPAPVRKEVAKEQEKTLLIDTSQVRSEEVSKAKAVPTSGKVTPIAEPKTSVPAKEVAVVEISPPKSMAQQLSQIKDEKKITIVDIPKSNSYVLITDPKTRLPKKYTVGEAIFTGEIIKKIDGTTGKVELNSRTVQME